MRQTGVTGGPKAKEAKRLGVGLRGEGTFDVADLYFSFFAGHQTWVPRQGV